MKHLLNTLYITDPDAYVHKKDDAIEIALGAKTVMSVPFHLIDGVVLFGHVGCSTAFLAACAENGKTVVLLDEHACFKARIEGPISGNVLLRREQYRRAAEDDECLLIARRIVLAKLHNSRIVLQHYARDYPELRDVGLTYSINSLKEAEAAVCNAPALDDLRGIEGRAARSYFDSLGMVIKRSRGVSLGFHGRTRRPTTDPVNSALSFFYTLASRDVGTACEAVGLDPQVGFLHACRPGRSSLALDLVEELRSPLVDRFVLSLFNRHQLSDSDFERSGQSVFFKQQSLKGAIKLWQEKKQEEIVHPFLKEKVKLGLIPFIQAQLFSRYLRGDLNDYPAILWR